ncbi:hypothetical protein FFLO_07042 [Filobasidium floriforme]|uniref:BRCT domain-containing protein n=1 Tax=Filobasidium floriforme TaxID=5210 RepID=A0A8K0NLJ2_9TREE|nr:hypothetical protein FFLO_07042 [Filobasidium floriforme]
MDEPNGIEIPPIENEMTGKITPVPIAAGPMEPNRMNVHNPPNPNLPTDRPIDYCFSNMIYWLDDSISSEQRDVLDRLLRERGGRPVARRGDNIEADHLDDGHTNGELGERDVDMAALVPTPDHAPTNDNNPVNSDPREQDQNPTPILLNPSMARFDIDACTHIITRSWNILERRIIEQDPGLRERLNSGNGNGEDGGGGAGLWIVKPEWVTRSVIVGLQSPQHYSPDPKLIFSGIIINCAEGFPAGDIDAIYGAVNTFGGQHRRFATKEITHMICVQPTPQQFKTITETGLGIKIVLPEWIQECIKLRRLVPVEPFEFTSATTPPPIRNALLVDPETSAGKVKRAFIDQDDHQRTLLWTSKRDIDQVFVQEQDPNAVQQTGVFAGKRVLLGIELGINAQTKEALDQWVIMAGGVAVSGEAELESCDVYITKWREGPGYSAAIKLGKTVGTLMWFYYVLRVGRLTSPMDELLHYPVPRDGVTGFAGLKIAITNYTGDSREYLKKLITAMGGTWTNDMARTENTHLVAANTHSDKVQRARHWGINTVNHFWLEDCFVRWERVGEGHPRYTDFPPGVNYMSLLGSTHLSDETLARWTRKAMAMGEEEEMGAVEQDVQLGDPTQPTPSASARPRTPGPARVPAKSDVDGGSGLDGDHDMDLADETTPKAGPSRQVQASRSASPIPKKTPASKRSKRRSESLAGSADEDRPAPSTTKRRRKEAMPAAPAEDAQPAPTGRARRQAATKAEDAVHAMAEDMNLYNREKKRKDIIPPSERKAARVIEDGDTSDATTKRGRRRSSRLDTETEAEAEDGEVGVKPQAKSSRSKKQPTKRKTSDERESVAEDVKPVVDGISIYLATTGTVLTAAQNKFFKKHGVVVTDDGKKVTHLVADSMKRTPKFLVAMNAAPIVVTTSWVEACVKADALVDEADHLLNDTKNEKKHGFKLAEALERAAEAKERGGLMIGHRLIVTAGLKPTLPLIKDLVTTAGGTVELHSNSKRLNVEPGAKTYLISCKEDRATWKAYEEKGVPIVGKEYVLQGIWSMRLEPDKHVCES